MTTHGRRHPTPRARTTGLVYNPTTMKYERSIGWVPDGAARAFAKYCNDYAIYNNQQRSSNV